MSPLRHLAVLVLPLASALAESPKAATHRAALVEGISAINAPGVPGAVCAFGPGAFAVVAGKEGKTTQSAVVAAGEWDKGRIVAFGHDGYLESTADAGTARLLLNSVQWAGNNRKDLKVIVRGPASLLEHLHSQGLNATAASGTTWTNTLRDAHVLCLDARLLRSSEHVPAVADWIRRGGGLVIAGTGWGWASLNPAKDLATDFPANQLIAPGGIVFAGGTPGKTVENGYLVQSDRLSALNASAALNVLLEPSPQNQAPVSDLAQMSATVAEAIRSLPPADTLLLPRLKALRTVGNRMLPGPGKPVSANDATARLLLTLDVQDAKAAGSKEVGPHPAADAFPGKVPIEAQRLQNRAYTIDTSIRDWHSTGLYAPAGEAITVKIPNSAAGKGLVVRIGAHSDKLWHLEKWQRVPEITTVAKLGTATTTVANPFGGLVYIVVPRGLSLGNLEVQISGAVAAPHFVLGRTKTEEWQKALRHAPGPWAELETRKVILTVPASAIRNLEDPEALLRFWDSALDAIADLAGISRERERPERIVTDVQISAGYMHSGYPIMTHLDVAERAMSVDGLKADGWGFWHELGHNHQVADWTFSGTTEVTCNLFSLFICEKLCEIAPGQGHGAMAPDKVAGRLNKHLSTRSVFERWKNDPFLALTMYDQLRTAFGWETYRHVFAEYRDLKSEERPKTDDEKRDQWMVRFSRAAGQNLGPFFQAWGVPTSDSARASIAHLPEWMPQDWPKQ